jgi:hypothetical protein
MDTKLSETADVQLTEYEMFMIESVLTRFVRENRHRKDITDFKQLMNRIGNIRLDLQS